MNIGIIGSGGMGVCLASGFVKLRHRVSIANSRGPASLEKLAMDMGARAATVEDVVTNNDVIVVSIPQKNVPHLPAELFKKLPASAVVIDTGNYYPTLRDGSLPGLEQHGIDSAWVQQQLGVPVVKVFNSILATSLQDLPQPNGDKNRVAIAVSGDRPQAKDVVFTLVDALGFDPFDVGNISQSWKQQPGSPVYCRDISLEELQKRIDALGTDWPAMRGPMLAKRKADEALMSQDYPAYLKTLRT